MGSKIIKSKDLDKIGYSTNKLKSLVVNIVNKEFKHYNKEEILTKLKDVKLNWGKYLNHKNLNKIAEEFIDKKDEDKGFVCQLDELAKEFKVYGKQNITPTTIKQMELCMQLPISKYGALMPDAHLGYGLPIGAVLATKDSVIPYGVGMDIACRMSLSLYKVSSQFLKRYSYQIKQSLKKCTHFGMSKVDLPPNSHSILEDLRFNETPLLKKLHGKAYMQLGSSGSGNHFVDFGEVQLNKGNSLNLEAGFYIGILAHSGSRGFGAEIANFYKQIAMQKCFLPKQAQHLAWLDMNTQEGQEYWLSMNLAGDYAKACHEIIHKNLGKSLGLKPVAYVENHHNFAWKEELNNEELIVHRKGATPAHLGEMGIIPANMIDTAFIVSGLGNSLSLNSASHGAGRKLSRNAAKLSITGSELKKQLKQNKVELIGGNVDEAPQSYKNMTEVMKSQSDLVQIEGTFQPKIIRMDKA